MFTIARIKRKVTPIAVKYGLPEVYLFGSHARGEAGENSDVDLLVTLSGSSVRGLKYCEMYEDFKNAFSGNADIVTSEALEEEAETAALFARNVKKDLVKIYERT